MSQDKNPPNMYEIALAAHEAGLCVLPPREDGTKQPDVGSWKSYQETPSTVGEIIGWFTDASFQRSGLALVTGHVSGDLEVLDVEDEGVYQKLRQRAEQTGLAPLLDKIEVGYFESTPKGGRHLLYRCAVIAGNTKLAKREKRPEERAHKNDLIATLIETRGEGGFIVVAPSHGSVHATGKPYVLLKGSFKEIVTIAPEERESLHDLARSFDEMPKTVAPEEVNEKQQEQENTGKPIGNANVVANKSTDTRPGSDFAKKVSWDSILTPHGWTAVTETGGETFWRRPGKPEGISATTNYAGSDLFYPFTTSTVFDSERGYSKFSVFAMLNHSGDFKAAARELAKKGYGSPSKPQDAKDSPEMTAAAEAELADAKTQVSDLLELVEDDHGVAFQPEILRALAVVQAHDTPLWARLRDGLRDAGVSLRMLDDAVSKNVPGGEIEGGGGTKGNLAAALVDVALDQGAELWSSGEEDAVGYVSLLDSTGRRANFRVKSRHCKLWLTRLARRELKATPSGQVLSDALNSLEAEAADGERYDAPYRVARCKEDGCIYLDLGNAQWNTVKIDPTVTHGWVVVDRPPVRFVRFRGMHALPLPVPGGSLADLDPFLNVRTKGDKYLVKGYATAAIRPEGPYPVLVSGGEHGSAKTTLARLLKKLIDPNLSADRSPPRDLRDLMIQSTRNWLMAFDNLSSLPDWLSDAFCRLSTGGGFATRELFTDDNEITFNAMRALMLNGIEDVVVRPDLLNRAIVEYHPVIPEDARVDEKTFWANFEAARPRIFGALLSAVAEGEKRLPSTTLKKKPRMADFALWLKAVEPCLGVEKEGAALEAYEANMLAASDLALEGSVVVPAIKRVLLESKGCWSGTASALRNALSNVTDEDTKKQRSWPKTAHHLSGAIRRLAPNLRASGMKCDFGREPTGSRSRLIELAWIEKAKDGEENKGATQNSVPERPSVPVSAEVGTSSSVALTPSPPRGAYPSVGGSVPNASPSPSGAGGYAALDAPPGGAYRGKSSPSTVRDTGTLGYAVSQTNSEESKKFTNPHSRVIPDQPQKSLDHALAKSSVPEQASEPSPLYPSEAERLRQLIAGQGAAYPSLPSSVPTDSPVAEAGRGEAEAPGALEDTSFDVDEFYRAMEPETIRAALVDDNGKLTEREIALTDLGAPEEESESTASKPSPTPALEAVEFDSPKPTVKKKGGKKKVTKASSKKGKE